MNARFHLYLAFGSLFSLAVPTSRAQANLSLYTDNRVNGFQDWSYNTTLGFANTNPVHSGSNSISVAITGGYGALVLEQPNPFDSRPYSTLAFWINGGTSGGQQLQVYADVNHGARPVYPLARLGTNVWQQVSIPLSALGAANQSNLTGFAIQGSINSAQPSFLVDEVQLLAAPAPAVVHLNANASQIIRGTDARWFGVNTATWDGNLGDSQTLILLREMGCLALRFPGGSTSDGYHWASDPTGNARFRSNATNLAGAQVFITVNYGSGTSNEAAGWVRSANITNHCGFKYWEIGNECYGSWENDTNNPAHDPYTYAVRSAGYIAMMKAADASIKVGVVVVTGEDSYANNANHPALNPRTGQTHNGWTPVLLATLKSLGVTPDFAVYHFYPEYTSPAPPYPAPAADSDALLLQAAVNWSRDAADLRQQIADYFGAGGTNIELVCTENNSDAGGVGKQLTSIVNGLYLADSLGQLMKTEFNALLWWDFRNASETTGSFDPTLYGWRTVGDEGMIGGVSGRYPPFYAEKLLQYFARPGDSVLNATSDYLLLSAYATRKTNGALALLIINKDATTNLSAQITLSNSVPSATAMVRAYGIPQDEAARTNAAASAQDISTNYVAVSANFTNTFPPYSLTLYTFSPQAPRVLLPRISGAQLIFQLQGQSGTPYVIQTASNLANWIPVSTNVLAGSAGNVTNALATNAPRQFWRAVWQP